MSTLGLKPGVCGFTRLMGIATKSFPNSQVWKVLILTSGYKLGLPCWDMGDLKKKTKLQNVSFIWSGVQSSHWLFFKLLKWFFNGQPELRITGLKLTSLCDWNFNTNFLLKRKLQIFICSFKCHFSIPRSTGMEFVKKRNCPFFWHRPHFGNIQ